MCHCKESTCTVVYIGKGVFTLSVLFFFFVMLCTGSIGVPAIHFVGAITKGTTRQANGRLVYGFASHSQRLAASLC